MYSLVLDRRARPQLRGIDGAHRLVMNRMVAALEPLVPGVARADICDLVLPGEGGAPPQKFAGNSLRVKRDHLLYHGTILYDFPLGQISRWLAKPRRQPAYRDGRDHGAFLTNLPATRAAIEHALLDAWEANERLIDAMHSLRITPFSQMRGPASPILGDEVSPRSLTGG
jgi:lipoate-protein ligase A